MKEIKYLSGEVVKVGDLVEIKRLIRRPLRGEVISVYDPLKPSPPKGENDYGVSIKLEDESFFWGIPNKETILISRKS